MWRLPRARPMPAGALRATPAFSRPLRASDVAGGAALLLLCCQRSIPNESRSAAAADHGQAGLPTPPIPPGVPPQDHLRRRSNVLLVAEELHRAVAIQVGCLHETPRRL